MEPYVGYSMSVMAGMAMLGAALWLGAQLPLTLPSACTWSYRQRS